MASTDNLTRALTAKPVPTTEPAAEPLKTAEPQEPIPAAEPPALALVEAAEPPAPVVVKAAESKPEPEPQAKKKKARLTPEEELEKIRQAQSKLGIRAARLRDTMRKKADRRKYEIGGLAVKAGVEEWDNETILGIFLVAVKTFETDPRQREGFRRKGAAVFAEDAKAAGKTSEPAEVSQAPAQARPAGPRESSSGAGSRNAAPAPTRAKARDQEAGQGQAPERTAPSLAAVPVSRMGFEVFDDPETI